MDRLYVVQRAQVAQMSSNLLAVKLWHAGVDEDAVDAMSREQRREAWAELVATGKDVVTAPAAATSSGATAFQWEMLAFEKRCFEAKLEFRAELEQRRADAADRAERRDAAAAAATGSAERVAIAQMADDSPTVNSSRATQVVPSKPEIVYRM